MCWWPGLGWQTCIRSHVVTGETYSGTTESSADCWKQAPGCGVCPKVSVCVGVFTWWFNDMEALSTLLALCEGNSMVTSGLPIQRARNRALMGFFLCKAKQAVAPTVKLQVIWEGMTLLWRQCNGNLSGVLQQLFNYRFVAELSVIVNNLIVILFPQVAESCPADPETTCPAAGWPWPRYVDLAEWPI